jgi:hypothetical protein
MTRPIVQPEEVITAYVARIGGAIEEAQSFEVLGV